MNQALQIFEHMTVVGSDGEHVGTVGTVEGSRIKLTTSDETSGGEHHYVPLAKVESVDGETVHLTCTADEATSDWDEATDDDESGGTGEDDDSDDIRSDEVEPDREIDEEHDRPGREQIRDPDRSDAQQRRTLR